MIALTGRQPLLLHQVTREATSLSATEHRPPQMWASSLPLCPKAFWLEAHGRPRMDMSGFDGDLRMNKGNAIHQALQRALARNGYLYGDWVCRRCGNAHGLYRTTIQNTFTPPPCPDHGPLGYEEVRVEVEGISGRVDGLVSALPRRLDDGIILTEWKTTTNIPDEPKPQHCEQANFYACALEGTLPIISVVVQYRHTEQPHRYVSYEIKPDLGHYNAQLHAAQYIRQHKDDDEPLWGLCDRGGDPYFCGYQSFCQRQHQRGGP